MSSSHGTRKLVRRGANGELVYEPWEHAPDLEQEAGDDAEAESSPEEEQQLPDMWPPFTHPAHAVHAGAVYGYLLGVGLSVQLVPEFDGGPADLLRLQLVDEDAAEGTAVTVVHLRVVPPPPPRPRPVP